MYLCSDNGALKAKQQLPKEPFHKYNLVTGLSNKVSETRVLKTRHLQFGLPPGLKKTLDKGLSAVSPTSPLSILSTTPTLGNFEEALSLSELFSYLVWLDLYSYMHRNFARYVAYSMRFTIFRRPFTVEFSLGHYTL